MLVAMPPNPSQEVELTAELLNDLRAAFNLFDTNQTGKADVAHLGSVRAPCVCVMCSVIVLAGESRAAQLQSTVSATAG